MKANIFIIIVLLLILSGHSYSQNISNPDSLVNAANQLLDVSKNKEAIAKYKEALLLYKNNEDSTNIKLMQYKIAYCYAAFLGDWVNAEVWLNKAMLSAVASSDKALIARINGNLGIIYDKTGKYKLSAEKHKLSLKYFKSANDSSRIVVALKSIGNLYLNQSNYYFASKYYMEAISYANGINDSIEIARITYNIGLLEYKKGNFGKAFIHYQEALNIFGDAISDIDKAQINNNLGMVYSEYGDTIKAHSSYKIALETAITMGHKNLHAKILNNIGNLFAVSKNYNKSLDYFQRAAQICNSIDNKREEAIANQNIGIIKQNQQKYDEAVEYFEKAKKTNTQLGYLWGQSYLNLRYAWLCIDMNNNNKAKQMLKEAHKIAQQLESNDLMAQIFSIEAKLSLSNGDTTMALEKYKQGIELIEGVRQNIGYESGRGGFMERVIPTYKALIELQLKKGDKENAYAMYERMKTRNLLEILDGANIVFDDIMDEKDIIAEQEIYSELRVLNNEMKNISNDTNNMRSGNIVEKKREYQKLSKEHRQKMLDKYPDLQKRVEVGMPADLQTATELLREDNEAAIVYMVRDESTFVFVLKHNNNIQDIEAIEIFMTKEELKKVAENIVEDWEIKKSEYLSEKLIKPILPHLKGIKKLCIIPDSYLYAIPFHALQLPQSSTFLIEDYSIYYDYSLSILRELKTIENSAKESVLAFGNPDFSQFKPTVEKQVYNALPKSEEEVLAIQSIYGETSKIFLNKEASEANFKSNVNDYNIIHLATHGIFNDVNPMYSSLLLTSGNGEDGYLSASEVIKMNVNSDLVVLSACETAKGIISDGEGMLGLSRAFLGAKVPTIVASLWQVDDRSTKLLMEQFYKNIKIHNDYAIALQKAQLYMLQASRYKNPFFWAPFIVIGDSK